MSLIQNISNPGSSLYYNADFRTVFEDHLSFILNGDKSFFTTTTLEPNTAARYAGDWRGLMTQLRISPEMHWFNLRLNGYTCSSDFDGSILTITVVDQSVIEGLLSTFKTVRKN